MRSSNCNGITNSLFHNILSPANRSCIQFNVFFCALCCDRLRIYWGNDVGLDRCDQYINKRVAFQNLREFTGTFSEFAANVRAASTSNQWCQTGILPARSSSFLLGLAGFFLHVFNVNLKRFTMVVDRNSYVIRILPMARIGNQY